MRQRSPRKPIAEGTRLSYNAGIEAAYVRNVKALLKPMMEEVAAEVRAFFEKPVAVNFKEKQERAAQDASVTSQAKILTDKLTAKFEQLFGRKALPIVNKMVDSNARASAAALSASLKKLTGGVTLSTNTFKGPLKEVLKASINENVGLIKTIGAEYLANVRGQVMRSITAGNGLADLVPALHKYEDISLRHAKNMALDQTRKVYSQLNVNRCQSSGIKKGRWLHSGGGQKPRKDHIELNGTIFEFANPPIIDKKTGLRGFPAQAINCKCTFTPVFDFEES